MNPSDEKRVNRRRLGILRSAWKCFSAKGFKATTMADIAKRVGMSVGNLYNYFPSKDAIVEELANAETQSWMQKMQKVAEQPNNRDLCQKAIEEVALSRLDVSRARVALEIISESHFNPRLAGIIAVFEASWRETLKPFYMAEGLSNEQADVAIEIDLSIVNGLGLRSICNPKIDRVAVAKGVACMIRDGAVVRALIDETRDASQ